jgi:hypothetical protein
MKNKDTNELATPQQSDVADPTGLSEEELAREDGEELPDREAMSLINANLAAPVNAAVAANVLSDNSVAYANAQQAAHITQGNAVPPPAGQ